MKAKVTFILLLTGAYCHAQTFTKVTTGAVVNDAAGSFSASWADYDNDGDLDLFVGTVSNENNLLYRNNGDGTFTMVASDPVVMDGKFTESQSWADYDNDGDIDLFITNTSNQTNILYQNNGDGTFTQVTSGVIVSESGDFVGCSWGDYDNDGYVDMFVSRYNSANILYRNNGDGTFTKNTSAGDIVTEIGASVGCAWGDYDNDGYLDMFVANYSGQNDFLYRNNGDGTFTKITTGPVVSDGEWDHGGSWGDYDNDGDLDLFVATGRTSYSKTSRLYRNNGDGSFTQVTGVHPTIESGIAKSSSWGDYDNDGDLDLFVARGTATGGNQDNLLYRNDGNGTFTKITSGSIVTDGGDARGCVWGDYDGDGDLDMFVSNELGQNDFLYQNNGNTNKWIAVRCAGTISNRSSIGAKVKIKAGGNWQYREISGQTGTYAQNALDAHFGLGTLSMADSLVVTWPSGTICEFVDVNANQYITVYENCTLVGQDEKEETAESIKFSVAPNPIISEAVISLDLKRNDFVSVEIQDVLGRIISRPYYNRLLPQGRHDLLLEKHNFGEKGIYMCVVRIGNQSLSEKLIYSAE